MYERYPQIQNRFNAPPVTAFNNSGGADNRPDLSQARTLGLPLLVDWCGVDYDSEECQICLNLHVLVFLRDSPMRVPLASCLELFE